MFRPNGEIFRMAVFRTDRITAFSRERRHQRLIFPFGDSDQRNFLFPVLRFKTDGGAGVLRFAVECDLDKPIPNPV